ncbi:TonB-dependent receptor [Phocaeicola plebeius]|uniref:TonB-dependent receptor n=1 Tax=Phocaeicola plebeius TaxID=310297 RepID=A0A415J2R8_9BACT|nr:TonB-dependent receptor [Phocaeicola plebeius]RHK94527.1 TonB-dependent receptor [Phocaeicola plebeius]RHL14198.1 TonB-dependent receptor [Phocaeicola plebeius]
MQNNTSRFLQKKRALSLLGGLFITASVFGQNLTVTGTVKDVTGEPVIGANVIQEGTSNGSITDIDGKFSLSIPKGSVLVISYIGYASQNVTVTGNQPLVITLKDDTELLDEVVVVGYGTMKKSDLTGAVGSVGAKDMKNSPISNVGQALQGKVAGLQIIDSGKPGDNVTIRVRGIGSINDSNPLIVIDGVPTDLGLNSINMADVERVDVLKDASATAIYGSRGANGVVMVTTRKGESGKGKLSFSANWAVQNVTNQPEMLNASQYAAYSNDMLSAAGQTTNPLWADPSSLTSSTDWLDEMFRTGLSQNYTVSYSGGNEKSHYYVSGGFLEQKGVVESVKYRRFTFQANTDSQVLNWLKFSNNLTFSTDTKTSGSYDVAGAMKALPTQPVKTDEGDWSYPGYPDYDNRSQANWYGTMRNPIGPIYNDSKRTDGYNLLANISAEIKFCDWLQFKSTFGYDAKFWFNEDLYPKYDWTASGEAGETSKYQSSDKSFTYLWDNYFTFNKDFGKHHLDAMVGSSAQWNKYNYMNGNVSGFLFNEFSQLTNAKEITSLTGSMSEWALLSYMARVNYSFDDKYLVTATVRRDGSSRFGENNRWGTFPSVSLAWRISKESWFPQSEVVSDLKLRAGYGVTGNQASIGNYDFAALFDIRKYAFGGKVVDALTTTSLYNPDIRWEAIHQANIGVDLSLFNSRVNLSLDAYVKNTKDMLVSASVPITAGFDETVSSCQTNAGKVRNKGVELALHTYNFVGGDFNWDTSLNLTYNTNEIVDLNSNIPMFRNEIAGENVIRLANGFPINTFYGYVTDGIFQNWEEVNSHAFQSTETSPGDIRFKDLNNDGKINEDDRTVIGNPSPKWIFSMNNNLSYKGFDLSIYLQGVSGNDIFNANNITNEGMAGAANQTTAVLNRWTGEGTSYVMPRAVLNDPAKNNRVSDRWVEDGSYLRIKNITLGYNFPKKWIKKLTLENARLFVSCDNVATITGYSGFDPEVDINGIDNNRYPISRTLSLGVNFNF